MSCKHGNHPDECDLCDELADHEKAYEILFRENGRLRAANEVLMRAVIWVADNRFAHPNNTHNVVTKAIANLREMTGEKA